MMHGATVIQRVTVSSAREARPAGRPGAPAGGWTLIPLTEPAAWRAALAGIPHAFAHTWESCRAMQRTTGHETHLVEYRCDTGRVVCPIARRTVDGHADLVTPFGFSGFVGQGTCPGFPEHWQAFARSLGFVSGYVALNPLLEQRPYYHAADRHCHQVLYVLDLRLDEAALFARTSRNRQRQLRAADETAGRLVTDQPRLQLFFARHFAEVMRTRAASSIYHLSPASVSSLLEAASTFLVGVEVSGRLEATTMFAHTPDVGESLFNVSLPEGRHHAARITWEGLRRLKALGVPLLNLGGGVRPGDGIAKFKERFGAEPRSVCALKQVYDAPTYDALCRAVGADPADRSGYFPAYHVR